MQSGSKFTDRIIKYLTKSAERKTMRASKSKGVGSEIISFMKLTPDKAKTQEFTDTMQ